MLKVSRAPTAVECLLTTTLLRGDRGQAVPHARGRRAVGAAGVQYAHQAQEQGAHAAAHGGRQGDEHPEDGGDRRSNSCPDCLLKFAEWPG